MATNEMVIDTKLDLVDYLAMVNILSSEYFDENGEYQPQYGRLNAMRQFYNYCVKSSKFEDEIPHDIFDALDMRPLVADEDFVKAFETAVSPKSEMAFDFANAYRDALDIVETRKNSFDRVIFSVRHALETIMDKINPLLTEDNIEKVSAIAKDIGNGKLSAQALVDAYADSDRFKEIVASGKADKKVVPLDHLPKQK